MALRIEIATYILTHLPTGAFYIGSTSSYRQRISGHRQDLLKGVHGNVNLQNLFKTDPNLDNFVFQSWSYTDREQAFDHEQSLLNQHRGSPLLLNMAFDARKARVGLPRSEETKARISETARGRPKTEEWKESRRGANHPRAVPVVINGVQYPTVREASEVLKIPVPTLGYRLRTATFPTYKFADPKTD